MTDYSDYDPTDHYYKKWWREGQKQKEKEKSVCECGAHVLGIKDFTEMHSTWCRAYTPASAFKHLEKK